MDTNLPTKAAPPDANIASHPRAWHVPFRMLLPRDAACSRADCGDRPGVAESGASIGSRANVGWDTFRQIESELPHLSQEQGEIFSQHAAPELQAVHFPGNDIDVDAIHSPQPISKIPVKRLRRVPTGINFSAAT